MKKFLATTVSLVSCLISCDLATPSTSAIQDNKPASIAPINENIKYTSVPKTVHGFTIADSASRDYKSQHMAECKNHGGIWDWDHTTSDSCKGPLIDVVPGVKANQVSWIGDLFIKYEFTNKTEFDYVKNSWIEYLYKTYGEYIADVDAGCVKVYTWNLTDSGIQMRSWELTPKCITSYSFIVVYQP